MFKKLIKFILLAPLLMAFQCDDEVESSLRYNDYKVKATSKATFSLNNTIWIEGVISSKAYDLAVKDSVFNDNQLGDIFSIFKFIEPTQISNSKDAIDNFELIFDVGEFYFLSACENAQMTAIPELDNDGLFYRYRIGLKPKATGDYLISWQNGIIQNENRNEFIIDSYRIQNNSNEIGFDRCGSVSSRLLNESKKEYFFSVE